MIENPTLLWIVVGSASGAILGLAGGGGSIAAIPLLMIFGGYDVKMASIYGLLSLSVGAFVNWIIRRKETVYPVVLTLVITAGFVSYVTAPLKIRSPIWVVVCLLNLVCVFNLYNLWGRPRSTVCREITHSLIYRLKSALFGGIVMGFVTTMTGLGGGGVIIPWLTGFTRLSFSQALSCSLLTIAIIAPFSAGNQISIDLPLEAWGGLICGVCVASLVVKKALSFFPSAQQTLIQKTALTSVILFSMWKTLTSLL